MASNSVYNHESDLQNWMTAKPFSTNQTQNQNLLRLSSTQTFHGQAVLRSFVHLIQHNEVLLHCQEYFLQKLNAKKCVWYGYYHIQVVSFRSTPSKLGFRGLPRDSAHFETTIKRPIFSSGRWFFTCFKKDRLPKNKCLSSLCLCLLWIKN